MLTRPEPPPWGIVISAALARAGLSAREAARRARLSEGRWRQITAGYQVVRPGVYASVRGPADTIARMAAVAGVTEAQLREAGRDDAAELLARQQESRPAVEQLLATIWAMDADQARSLLAMIVVQLGLSLEQRDQPDAGELTEAERPAPGLAGVELAAVEPAAVEPAAVEPAAVEPAAVEPAAGRAAGFAVRDGALRTGTVRDRTGRNLAARDGTVRDGTGRDGTGL